MKYFSQISTTAYAGAIFLSSVLSLPVQAIELAGPPFSVMDKNYVNVATLQVSPSLTDVTIGGEMGLAHTISTHSSSFGDVFSGGHWGPVDSYQGMIRRKTLSTTDPSNWVYLLEVTDGSETVDFRENNHDGTYPALRDERYTLKFISGQGFIMTKPDGTEVLFASTATTASTAVYSALTEIRKPNGVIIRIINSHPNSNSLTISSVNTNTGFQLKYLYQANNQGLASDNPAIPSPAVDTVNWHAQMPKYVVAINNAVEYCDPRHSSQGGTCSLASLTRSWPKAEYTWPGGMPRAMVLYDTVFKVKDAAGRTTEYHHRPFQTEMSKRGQPDSWPYHPRIVAIKR